MHNRHQPRFLYLTLTLWLSTVIYVPSFAEDMALLRLW